ncbi:hypothetical protein GN156_16380 [bacterium LRH843]|nr:hypothetical protein [bacterium LRH843]
MKLKALLLGVLVILLFVGCVNEDSNKNGNKTESIQTESQPDVEGKDKGKETETDQVSPEAVAKTAIHALKNQDMSKLSELTHPSKGILFSPYGYINEETAKVFRAEEVKDLLADQADNQWGFYDGSGEPILLTFSDYYKIFVYDVDFADAPEKSLNERLGHGNTPDNSKDVFPDASVFEFYYPGTNPKYNGMDWKSLRLILVEEDNKWYVIGIVHDEWTI